MGKAAWQRILGLWRLIRPTPVAAWAVVTPALGLVVAWSEVGYGNLDWRLLAWSAFVMVGLHGLVSHAINDEIDWRSGTDIYSPGVLSGGSKAVHLGLVSLAELPWIAWISLGATTLAGVYVATMTGPWVWLYLLIGIWAAIAYSLPPLRLSYRPLLGEWLCAWPALMASSCCVYYIVTGQISNRALLAGALHGVFCLGWLMEHHISDVSADLMATPAKRTTVAYTAHRWGVGATPLVPTLYFLLALPLGILLFRHDDDSSSKIAILGLLALAAAITSKGTTPALVTDITQREKHLIVITFIHAILLGWMLVI